MNWLENIRDWCISRQLWWGHRLPVFYTEDGEIIVSEDDPDENGYLNGKKVTQEEDTLDTWFSSALWPFATLGWPEETEDYKYFFPTDILVTGYDIIFFWVIRMVFSSLYNTNKTPFDHVLFTGLIRDPQGRKMSKSLGNGVDPIDVVNKYGADALRFTIITGNSPGNDMRYDEKRIVASRNFANKLWNATGFVLMNVDENDDIEFKNLDLSLEDKWILKRLNNVVEEVSKNLDKYEIGLAASRIEDFIWEEFCDWYIEFAKERLNSDDENKKATVKKVLLYVLKDMISLLHPFMPFITEEIYKQLPNKKDMLIVESWPQVRDDFNFDSEARVVDGAIEAIKAIRNQRQTLIDYDKERKRLKDEIKKLESEIKRAEGKLNNQGFVSKAPEAVVNEEREKLEKYKDLLEKTQESYKEIEDK